MNEKIMDENKYMHILFLYDENNIYSDNLSFKKIKNNIINFLKTQHFPKEFKKIIFQILF